MQCNDIITSVQEDYQRTIGTNHPALIDYTDRVHQDILQHSTWRFMQSTPQRFVTEFQRSDYWIGTLGSNPSTAVDTTLNLNNFQRVVDSTVYDRSNQRRLYRTQDQPNNISFQDMGGQVTKGRPRQFRNDYTTPYLINLFPAPDNESTYQPVPNTPIIQRTSGGALPARTYLVVATFVDNNGGESSPSSSAATEFFTSGQLMWVRSPVPPISVGASGILYNQYNVYAGPNTQQMTLQNVSPILVGTDWIEPISGLTTTGVATPYGSATIAECLGYVIEFCYIQSRNPIVGIGSVLQIPNDYKDVVVAGVNYLAAKYLDNQAGMLFWQPIYQAGKVRMIKDRNFQTGDFGFMGADSAALPINPNSQELFNLNDLLP